MSKFRMDIYTEATGVQMTISWANEDQYNLGRKFLLDMNAGCGQSRKPSAESPEFFYLQNKQQLDALFAYRQKLKMDSAP